MSANLCFGFNNGIDTAGLQLVGLGPKHMRWTFEDVYKLKKFRLRSEVEIWIQYTKEDPVSTSTL